MRKRRKALPTWVLREARYRLEREGIRRFSLADLLRGELEVEVRPGDFERACDALADIGVPVAVSERTGWHD